MCAKVLTDKLMQKHIWWIFKQNGISEDRIILEPYPEIEAFYKKFNEIDIHLDPFPYNGGTTTFDSLWMGTPTINLLGDRWASRFGLMILDAIGCKELVAESPEEYLNLAIKFAQNPNLIETYKKTLREKFLNSGFFDYQQLTKDLEVAFKQIYASSNNLSLQSVPSDGSSKSFL
jgi:predicted O-linked N-acetylglucosamine transferase (SPINDLY family)